MDIMTLVSWGIVIFFSCFLGSISMAILLTQILGGGDIREKGSKNAGATNTLRIMGKKAALAVLIGDMAKGTISVILGNMLLGLNGAVVAAACCVLGHIFPVMFKFKGGKGAATMAGVMVALDWKMFIIAAVLFFPVVYFTKYVSVGSLVGVLTFFVWAVIAYMHYPLGLVMVTIICCMVVYKHKDNIKRLLKGEESKISFKKGGNHE